jgi:hypothetical protein
VDKITRVQSQGEGRQIVRVGVDLAKRVIQVHAVDAGGRVVTSRALARDKFVAWCAQLPTSCLVVMEVSSSAHHWARKLRELGLDARIVAAQLASPYPISQWVLALKLRAGWQKAVVALANKHARILWAIMTKEARFDRQHVSAKPA